jgi:hypothetical protein
LSSRELMAIEKHVQSMKRSNRKSISWYIEYHTMRMICPSLLHDREMSHRDKTIFDKISILIAHQL